MAENEDKKSVAEQTAAELRQYVERESEKWSQVNDDGSPITDKRYKRTGEHEYTFMHSLLKIDHTPTGLELGRDNLNMIRDSETAAERGRKGQALQQQRRSAQESMRMLLGLKATKQQANTVIRRLLRDQDVSDADIDIDSLPDGLTQYDLINLAMTSVAKLGSDKAATYVRDTAGDKPTDKTEISGNIMTDGDRDLIAKIRERMLLDGSVDDQTE